MVRLAAQFEYARTVADVLALRSRLLFLDAALAKSLAAPVAALLQKETGVVLALDKLLLPCDQYPPLQGCFCYFYQLFRVFTLRDVD